jgi:iron-sulfur cluster repair protein YtfE (RIC family)
MSETNFHNAGQSLIRIHKTITRGLAVTIQHSQGNGPNPEQQDGFQRYTRALVGLLHAHHLGEDEVAFPFWKGRAPQDELDTLYQQHQEMLPLLDQVSAWLDDGKAAWEATALAELNQALVALNELWHTHITREEDVLGPETSSKMLSHEENVQLDQQLAAHGQQHAQPSELVMPFVLYNLEEADRQAFAKNLPPELVQHVIPVVWKPTWEPMQPFFI